MLNSGPLLPAGYAIMLITGLLMVVPFMRRRADAITAWNLLLLGCFIFLGMANLEVVYGDFHWPELKWFQPSVSDVDKYLLGEFVFLATLIISYYYIKLPRTIASHFLNKWPPMTPAVVYFILGICGVLATIALFTQRIAIIGPFFTIISFKAVLFATVFSFCHWYRRKIQMPMLALFLVTFAVCALYSMTVYSGRRLLLSVGTAPLICLYWLSWRYNAPKRNAVYLTAGLAGALLLSGFYSTFRHVHATVGGEDEHRTMRTTFTAMRNKSLVDAVELMTQSGIHYFGQYAGHNSLLTIHLIDTKTMRTAPFNSLLYIASYPVPRKLWPDKPDVLGKIIVHDVLNLPYMTNWGMGIVGIAYYEGGYFTLILYAFLAVVGVRLIDDNLQRQPDNVFLLAILCYSAPHIIAWIRGETVQMTIAVVEAVVFAWLLGVLSRFFFGTARTTTYPGGAAPLYGQPYSQLGHSSH